MQHKQIIKGKRNNIYKGHCISGFSSENKIVINNNYYNTTITEEYDSKTDETSKLIFYRKDNPKWLNKLMDDKFYTFKTFMKDDLGNKQGIVIDISINPYYSLYEIAYKHPKISFDDPTGHIATIKYYQKIFSAFHKKLKITGNKIKDFEIVDNKSNRSFNISDRFFNEFDLAKATSDNLPF